MSHLIMALVGVLTVAVAANLLLTAAVIRKLRAAQPYPGTETWQSPALPAVGTDITSLEFLDRAHKTGRWLFAILSPGCPACKTVAAQISSVPERVLAVLIDEDDPRGLAEVAALLPPGLSRIEVSVDAAHALGVTGFPAVLTVDDGVITAAAYSLSLVDSVA